MNSTRRIFLLAMIALLVLPHSGCNTVKTKVVFENRSGVSMSVNVSATARGVKHVFRQNRIANGKSYSKNFISAAANRQVVYAEGTVTIGSETITIPANTVPVVLGISNTYRLSANTNGNLYLIVAQEGKVVAQLWLNEPPTVEEPEEPTDPEEPTEPEAAV